MYPEVKIFQLELYEIQFEKSFKRGLTFTEALVQILRDVLRANKNMNVLLCELAHKLKEYRYD